MRSELPWVFSCPAFYTLKALFPKTFPVGNNPIFDQVSDCFLCRTGTPARRVLDGQECPSYKLVLDRSAALRVISTATSLSAPLKTSGNL